MNWFLVKSNANSMTEAVAMYKEAALGRLLNFSSSSALPSDEIREQNKAKAEELRNKFKKRYNVTPLLSGSMATGTDIDTTPDFDFAIPIRSANKYTNLKRRLDSIATKSPYNKENADYDVYSMDLDGQPIDVALLYGNKGLQQREAYKRVNTSMSRERLEEIRKRKHELKNAFILPDYRYKKYKRAIDKEFNLPKFKREQLKEASLNRNDVYGQRTANLDAIIKSNRILTAAEAAERGLIRDVETNNMFSRSRRLLQPGEEHAFRDETFITKGLLPADSGYGRYGVLFQSRKATPSRYLNKIPTEHVLKGSKASKLTFVVPDEELQQWKDKYPEKAIIPESSVPESKQIKSAKQWSTLAQRLFSKPKLWQDVRRVRFKPNNGLADKQDEALAKTAAVEYHGKTFPGYNQPIASDRAEKKKMVLAKEGDKVKLIHFGQKGYKHNYSNEAKQNYLKRSAGIVGKNGLTKNDKMSANYWARRELWPRNEPADGTAKDK